MGFRKSYNIVNAMTEIRNAAFEASSKYNDGFIQWGIKQDLYQLKWLLDDIIKTCPDFGTIESDWLTQQEHYRLINIIKDNK